MNRAEDLKHRREHKQQVRAEEHSADPLRGAEHWTVQKRTVGWAVTRETHAGADMKGAFFEEADAQLCATAINEHLKRKEIKA
jgi:hypothetical protein